MVKCEEDGADQEERGHGMVPAQVLAEVPGDEHAEDHQRNDFLDDLELDGIELNSADAVGRHLKAVLEESDAPTDENDLPKRLMTEPEVTIPGKSHEDVRDGEKNNCPHFDIGCAAEMWSWKSGCGLPEIHVRTR